MECKIMELKIKKEFLKELKNLLSKYNIEISAEDAWVGYPECGEDIKINIDFYGFSEDIQFDEYIDLKNIEKKINNLNKEINHEQNKI